MTRNAPQSSYYVDRTQNYLKDLAPLFTSAARILPDILPQDQVPVVIEQSHQGFTQLLGKLPDLGGDRNLFNPSIIAGVAALAYIQALEKQALPLVQVHESIYNVYRDAYATLPGLVKAFLRGSEFSRSRLRRLHEFALWTQERGYPENFIVEFVPGGGNDFDFGFDCTQCAVLKFFQRMDAAEHMPFVCIGDFAASGALKTGLHRTTSLVYGAARCDFRFKKGRDSLPGLPLEGLPEYKYPQHVKGT